MPEGPLSGYRIIDLSQVLSGPAATRLLADQGTDVIKVEPFGGDITRVTGAGKNGMTASHLNINRGKRAISIDLKNPAELARAVPSTPIRRNALCLLRPTRADR
jgi:crotonobetainyl-CoA:carnitine CoA-transferase CaiB-like acyl-CoA transferase